MGRRGELLGIAMKTARGVPLIELQAACISRSRGVADDVCGKPGRRQVTIITRSAWEAACAAIGAESLPWTSRRANLLVDGIDLKGKIGYDVLIGERAFDDKR